MNRSQHRNKAEILAPCGNFECVTAACECGADAVYIGGNAFSARASADNFSDEEIAELVRYCHLRGVQVHRAMNIVVTDRECSEFLESAEASAEAGVDAFIVQDFGAAQLIKRYIPDIPLHASTQMTIHTVDGAKAAQEMGFSRVVVSRELSLDEIARICETGIETEAFVHGALCMCVSGQCYMSAAIGGRSANRGRCAQACRLPFSAVGDKTERYDLSLKDMCHIEHIEELYRAGVSSFKIEGRMKRPEYVAAAVSACNAAINGMKPDIDTLRAVFSRSGFTDGYYTGNRGNRMFGYRRKEDVTSANDVLPRLKELYRSTRPVYDAKFEFEMKADKNAVLSMNVEDVSVSVCGDVPQKALNRPTDSAMLEKQLSKLGGTVYSFGGLDADIDDGLMLPASALNDMRRKASALMDEKIISENRPKYDINKDRYIKRTDKAVKGEVRKRAYIRKAEQLDGALSADLVIVPISELTDGFIGKLASMGVIDRIIAAPPRFISDEIDLKKRLGEIYKSGIGKLYCNNIAHICIGKNIGFELHGGFGLNITNSESAMNMKSIGLSSVTTSFELRISAANELDGCEKACMVYARYPVMLVRNCPVRQAVGCSGCKGTLTDRTGRSFPVSCDGGKREYAEIFNCDPLYICDRTDELHGFSYLDYLFLDERSELIEKIVSFGKKPERYTRGMYYTTIE